MPDICLDSEDITMSITSRVARFSKNKIKKKTTTKTIIAPVFYLETLKMESSSKYKMQNA